jgi:hypothetical protein
MSVNSALSIASGGLANINAQFALISQNVANAATPGYAVEVGNQQDVTSDGIPLGVQTGPATLQIDQALQASVTQQNAIVSNAKTTQTALQGIDSVLGTPGSGSDIGSLLLGGQHTECHPDDDRSAQQPDRRPQVRQPEHRRVGKSAEYRRADAVATACGQDR